jgi:hypothetical protein
MNRGERMVRVDIGVLHVRITRSVAALALHIVIGGIGNLGVSGGRSGKVAEV